MILDSEKKRREMNKLYGKTSAMGVGYGS